jgi:muconolactone delta-isomerase
MEFLVTMTTKVPTGTTPAAAEGWLLRLWTVPGGALGQWQATNPDHLRSRPLADLLTTEVVPLTRHPSEPRTEAYDDRAA